MRLSVGLCSRSRQRQGSFATKSSRFRWAAFFRTLYSHSLFRLPALIESNNHSGRTTWLWTFALTVRAFCVFEALSCWEVRICVAPLAVLLGMVSAESARGQLNDLRDDSTSFADQPFQLDVGCVGAITTYKQGDLSL